MSTYEKHSKSSASSSSAKWSTKSNRSHESLAHKKDGDTEKSRKKFEKSLWSLLNDTYPKSVAYYTHEATGNIMKLVDKYCRFRSGSYQSSHAAKQNPSKTTNSSKSSSMGKSNNHQQSSNAVKSPGTAKPSSAPKPSIPSKPSGVTNNAAKTFKPPSETKSKSGPRSTKKNNVKKSEKTFEELQNELKRLSDSDGFVPQYPVGYKRVPKPVDRFALAHYDKKKRQVAVGKRYNELDDIDETPKKKRKVANPNANNTVYKVQQSHTISQTTSTIVSQVTGAGTTSLSKKIISSTEKTAVCNFLWNGAYVFHLPMIQVKEEK